jgi:hypothetical protein
MFPLLLVLGACDGEDDLDCDFYGFDLLSAVERPIRVEVDEPGFGFVELLDPVPVELHSEQSCGGKVLYPSDLPPLIGSYLDGDGAEFSVELPEEAWTGRRIDNARGYPFYRAEILEEYLIPL